MDANDAVRVNCAVRYGLAGCLESPLRLTYLDDFVASLRRMGWRDEVVAKVKRELTAKLREALFQPKMSGE